VGERKRSAIRSFVTRILCQIVSASFENYLSSTVDLHISRGSSSSSLLEFVRCECLSAQRPATIRYCVGQENALLHFCRGRLPCSHSYSEVLSLYRCFHSKMPPSQSFHERLRMRSAWFCDASCLAVSFESQQTGFREGIDDIQGP
jgi:hypothetical protein